MNTNQNYIEIKSSQLGDYVGVNICISGWVDLKWFESKDKLRNWWEVGVEYLALDRKPFMGGFLSFNLVEEEARKNKIKFSAFCELISFNIPFIQKSHGRMVIEIESPNGKPSIYLPVIVKQFEDEQTMTPDIIKKHFEVGETVSRYKREIEIYYKEMAKIYEDREKKDEGRNYDYLYGIEGGMMASEIFKILESGEEIFNDYIYAEEDRREEELGEKYKDAIDWIGPSVDGLISKFEGFELRVYSNDHDQHFHVIHRGNGINARFSFPDMQLLNYKSLKTTISSKAEKNS